MGGSPKAPKQQPVPEAPKPIDYDKMANASIRVAKETLAAEEEAVKRLYPQYIGMQFDTAAKLSKNLDNQYLGRVRGVVDEELAAASTPNTIEAELQRQAETELALGRSLTPEQERAATQQARAGMAARGLGAGTGALAAEVLNRDAYASQREADRRAFAGQANQIDLARRQRRTGLAGLYGDLDPYRAAMGPAFGLGSTTLGQTSGQVRDIYGGSLAMAGNVESFNKNMAATDRNTILNNNAALKAASITGSATNNAGWMSMLGGLAEAGGSIYGGHLAGKSDRREKTAIKKIGKDPLGLNTYKYKYKGDDRTRTGPMAQDVRKVLPEAVEEVEIKGKKRLAIRPKVLGQAYADAIAAEQDIMFPDGYVVGSGKA